MADATQILVTGGTGYIGSHTCVALIERGIEPVILDNLSNSNPVVLERIARITNHRPAFYQADVRDSGPLEQIFQKNKFGAVIHFAGLKSVREPVEKPREYQLNNVEGSRVLLEAMRRSRTSASRPIHMQIICTHGANHANRPSDCVRP